MRIWECLNCGETKPFDDELDSEEDLPECETCAHIMELADDD